MNLLYDHQIFVSQQYGGISRYFSELISRLLIKNSISLHMGFYINKYGLDEYMQLYANYFGFRKLQLPRTSRLFSVVNTINFEMFTNRLKDIDIYHATYYSLLLPSFKVKRVVTVHDMIHDLFPEYFTSRDATARSKKNIVESCDGIICVSKSTKNDLISLYNIPEEKIKVIYHANSINCKVSTVQTIVEPYILYVGSRGGYKNFKMLLLAYANSGVVNRNYKLVCFGGGAFNQEEAEIITNHQLEGKVIHLSGSDETLANLYNYAEVYVMPSLYEGFGIPLLEAMSYGCPVLASNCSSIPEVVGNAGLYFNPNSAEELSIQLLRILNEQQLRADLIQYGYKQVGKFSWDKCSEETLAFYNNIF